MLRISYAMDMPIALIWAMKKIAVNYLIVAFADVSIKIFIFYLQWFVQAMNLNVDCPKNVYQNQVVVI